MSVQAISWVIENSKQKGGSFVVLLMIANHAHSDGTGAFPSFDTLAREARMSYRQITRIIPKLAKSGELRVEKSAGPHGVNVYSLPFTRDILSRDKRDEQGHNVETFEGHKCPPNRKEPKVKTEPSYRSRKPRAHLSPMQEIALRRKKQDEDVRRELMAGGGPS